MRKYSGLNIIIAVLSLAVFAIIAYLTCYVAVFNTVDQNVVEVLHNIALTHPLVVPKFLTDLGDGYIILLLLLVFSVILACFKQYKEALLLNLATNSAFLSSEFLKEFFKRLRPALEYQMVHAEGYTFPSLHMLIAVCFYGILIYIIFRLIKNKLLKNTLLALLMLLIFLIGLSRIYLGVHYPTDIAASLFFGIFIIFFWINLYN